MITDPPKGFEDTRRRGSGRSRWDGGERIEGVTLPADRRLLMAAVEHVRRAVYFDYVAISAVDGDGRSGRGLLIYTDWPQGFVEAYAQGGWFEHDPAIHASRGAAGPVTADEVVAAAAALPRADEVIAAGRSHGVAPPMVVPIRHLQRQVGIVSISRHKPFTGDEVYFFGVVAPALHREFAQDLRLMIGPDQHLSRREVECLRHASTGMTSEEIATVLPLAAATVTAHLRNAAGKLGASNRVQAIAEALRRGIID